MNVRFGEWELDSGRRELLRAGEPIGLTPKAFQLLELLVENRPQVVTKARIYEHLWPSTFVSEVNLSRLVFELRAALADDPRKPRWVRTARGLGYAFCGPAAAATPPSRGDTGERWCWLILAAREVSLAEGENVIGRSRDAAVCLTSASVSRHHARIVVSGTQATIEDLGSKNGTSCRGSAVTAPTTLGDGDAIRVGSVKMTFRVVTPEGSTTTAHD